MDILADTVFLIDLWREASSPGRATAYARAHASQQVGIPWIVAGEFQRVPGLQVVDYTKPPG